MAGLNTLQETIGVFFKEVSLLKLSLAHSSYVNEKPKAANGSNERLEFLGDAILGYVVAEKLYRDFPELTEGEMTKFRAALVCRDALVRLARSVNLGSYLYLGRGEEASGGRQKEANLAGALEAVIAAVYLDQGLAVARDFVLKLLGDDLGRVSGLGVDTDYKSQLQEIIQSKRHIAPTYRTVEVAGPDHDQNFTVEVMVEGTVVGRGSGKSKKLAETEAAHAALARFYS